jgi:hypothetical protein
VTDNLSLKDLLKLLEKCKQNGVSEIKFGALSVVFGEKTTSLPLTPSSRQTKANEIQTQEVEQEALQMASKELDDDELETMSLENPQMFEQLLIEKELEHDGSRPGAESAQH